MAIKLVSIALWLKYLSGRLNPDDPSPVVEILGVVMLFSRNDGQWGMK